MKCSVRELPESTPPQKRPRRFLKPSYCLGLLILALLAAVWEVISYHQSPWRFDIGYSPSFTVEEGVPLPYFPPVFNPPVHPLDQNHHKHEAIRI